MMAKRGERRAGREELGNKGVPLYLPNAALVGEERQKEYEVRSDADMLTSAVTRGL